MNCFKFNIPVLMDHKIGEHYMNVPVYDPNAHVIARVCKHLKLMTVKVLTGNQTQYILEFDGASPLIIIKEHYTPSAQRLISEEFKRVYKHMLSGPRLALEMEHGV